MASFIFSLWLLFLPTVILYKKCNCAWHSIKFNFSAILSDFSYCYHFFSAKNTGNNRIPFSCTQFCVRSNRKRVVYTQSSTGNPSRFVGHPVTLGVQVGKCIGFRLCHVTGGERFCECSSTPAEELSCQPIMSFSTLYPFSP
ncbi:hypothetical protein CDAR_620951 [Caerostris darwini]|uniref:Secreted protein n=1 Tax=Caerostris darwini TaxID=1538125 RepID=A0AAV4USL5_9ARAC|nr:hypothetical protein CDAR_620951 [Caerostris darwini]